MIRLFTTTINENAKKEVMGVLDSTFISAGKKCEEFEKKLTFFGLNRPVSVNSGTSALHLALKACGIQRGDEVILPAQTFIATGLSILYQEAKPIFADIDYTTGNISVKDIEKKITEKTKAIIVVHWGGYPCDMDEILKLAKKHNLTVIEDAAHALGSTYKDKPIGSISDFTCFSFQAIKMLTTGDGGAVCSLSEKHEKKLKKLRWFNIDRDLDKPDLLGERVYNSKDIGYKYHMNDLSASIGIGNLFDLNVKLNKTKKIAEIYSKELSNVKGIELFNYKNDRVSAYWLFGFHVDGRFDFIKKLRSNKIDCSVVHLGIDDNNIFGGKHDSLVNQRKFDSTQINIPIHSELNDGEIYHIIKTIKDGW